MAAAPGSRFLQVEALNRLGNMRLSFRKMLEGPYAGRHESVQRGGAVEFVDFRQYTPGEDLRRLDWKVLGRLHKPYVRIFADETNLLCTVLLDTSTSMLFSGHLRKTDSKLDHARYLAAATAFLVTRERDQVALAVSAGRLGEYRAPGSTALHLARICETLEAVKPAPETDIARALQDLFPMVRRRGVLMILSDFLVPDLEAVFAALRLYQYLHFEIILLHIVHPEEQALPKGPAYRFEDLEDESVISCSPLELARIYEEAFSQHMRKVSSMAAAGGCKYRFVSTAVPYVMTLKDMLVERRG